MKQVTIKDIAREAGVSVASVSRALNNQEGISEERKNQILEVCERLSYTPNGLARSLVKKRTQTIGILMPDIRSPFYSELMVLASDFAHKKGYQVLLCNSFRDPREEERYLKLLVENQVEGILMFPINSFSADTMEKYKAGLPIVSLNELPDQKKLPYVCADEAMAGELATEYLISKGCKNLLFVGFKKERLAHRYRADSFMKTAAKRRIPARIYECGLDYRSSFERGYGHFRHFLMNESVMPDGIVAASDATANGIVKACREFGIRIPEDFSLIGFDNISTELPYLELTTVAVSHEKQVGTAMELLLGMIQGKQLSRAELAVKLVPRLIERKSCKR